MNYKDLVKNKKGVAGLNIFLAVIAMLFMIGIIVMVFIVAAAELEATAAVAADPTAVQAINDTKAAISTAIDFFDVIIVLAAMVVLILLVVIMINSIRGSGITGGA